MKRQPYVAPEGLDPKSLEQYIIDIGESERVLRKKLSAAMRDCLNAIRKAFADPANAFDAEITKYREAVTEEKEEDAKQQIETLKQQLEELKAMESKLPEIEQAEKAQEEANIEENEFTDESYDDLRFAYEQVVGMYNKKIAFLQAQVNESETGLTPEQMQEFRESFDAFDESKDGKLQRLEFRSCMNSLGLLDIDFTGGEDKHFEEIWDKLRNGNDYIDFDSYCNFMKEMNDQNPSPDQVNEIFGTISNGKDFVTETDMQKAGMTAEQIEYVKANAPAKGEGYDYKALVGAN